MDKNLWFEEENGITTVGVTEELQDDAGDISYANIAELGNIDVDETLLNVEASKATIEIPSPFLGDIVDRNELAENNPEHLNSTDKSKNWIVKYKQK